MLSFINQSSKPVNLNVYFDTKRIHQFPINGCHAVDLSLYLLSDFDPKILGVVGDLSDQSSGFSFIGQSKNGHILNFNNPWGAPSRARLDCYNSEENIQLMPFEALEVSNKMKVVEPTDSIPIRRYIPNAYHKDFVSSRFKPGFLEQAKSALNFTSSGVIDKRICTFDQALKTVIFIEKILEQVK